jgi:NADH-quinone oxidoreductase subunit L
MNGPLLFLPLIPLLPFLGFLINGILGRYLPKALVSFVALAAPLASFTIVVRVAYLAWSGVIQFPWIEQGAPVWLSIGNLHVDFGSVLDQLSLVMLLVVTGVGFLIHVYSVGYMHDDPGYARFFSYLNLFLFFMTTLVLAGNVLVMFVGWEGVGLASYLLIGFWFQKKTAVIAGKKAFIANRIGDFGFLIGIFLLLANFGTLNFRDIAERFSPPAIHLVTQGLAITLTPVNSAPSTGILTITCLCLLLGAAGKSAQLPLYVWLPDAMEGPTPVSALIHAATMVTAGVYMIARAHVLFDHAPIALTVVAIIGAATALFAATIGLVQTDIKRVLAYSTISQLGYMFLACGVAAYSAAIFHLVTHAFFKALLFLAAGSVIHAMHDEQDMRKMGGLRKKLPVTFWTMTTAVFTISGFPPLAAFFSKDAILYTAFLSGPGGKVLWFVGLFTALLTSLYMFRLWYLTFFGEPRTETGHHHSTPLSMLVPLVILALLSICGGWIGIEHLSAYLAPSVGEHPLNGTSSSLEWTLSGLAVLAAALGWYVAYLFYSKKPERPAELAAAMPAGYQLLTNKYYVDEIYSALILKPVLVISKYILGWAVDGLLLGGIAWLLAGIANLGGMILQRWQSGNLRSYAAWLALGAAALLIFLLWPDSRHIFDFAFAVRR